MGEVSEAFRPENLVQFDDIVRISAKQRWHIDELKQQFRRLLDMHADMQQDMDKLDRRWEALMQHSSEHYGRHLV